MFIKMYTIRQPIFICKLCRYSCMMKPLKRDTENKRCPRFCPCCTTNILVDKPTMTKDGHIVVRELQCEDCGYTEPKKQ